MTHPYSLTALEARRQIIDGDLSASELLDSCLGRIGEVNPSVNAMVTVASERAEREAAVVDRRLAAAASPEGRAELFAKRPLLGLPVAIKDLQATAEIRTTLGSAQFADHVPDVDAAIVAKIRAAGGIIVGKTNLPERSIGANTVNRLFGATGNPFDPTLTCGGSSGGSAVVLATAMVPLATGSDHGGSLRIPASYCGVVGFRATPGVVPFEERAITQTFYSVQGPMARTVEDTALLLSVVAARSSIRHHDPMAFPLDTATLSDVAPRQLSELRIGVSADLGGVTVSRVVREQFARRVDWLASRVGSCQAIDIDLTDATEVDWNLRAEIFATYYHAEAAGWDDGFNPNIRTSYNKALATPMADVARARHRQMELVQSVQTAMEDIDLLICPGVSVPPFPWRSLYPTEIDDEPVENYMAWLTLTAAITVVGHPVVSLPAGLDDAGLPFGIQLVGSAYDDRRLLMAARSISDAWIGTDFARPVPDIAALLAADVDLGPGATESMFR